ncbi:hypothetical protein AYL99_09895 [Fonsecaea erecta]|uniref:Protein kinase domain-containing protein n=1 Tax=Fonsecaea erecta TaxID=1367422 RepID=A0A178Z981_9EURO|nr:hypothetical protein AYL99_09895 [Fonsecaea erecta]OAP55743.1 hypothetical protein AYL99_09895 [Fonsecaea erecta]
MDVFMLTDAVIRDVYAVTVFIKQVVDNFGSYGPDTDQIKRKLVHELLYVETFQSNFFEDPDNAEAYRSQSPMLQADVKSTLDSLNKVLAEYGIEAAKHGILTEDEEQVDPVSTTRPKKSAEGKGHSRLHKRIENYVSAVKEIRKKLVWSLFEKDKILQMLVEYSEWTNRLRQSSALMTEKMLWKGYKSFAEFANTKSAQALGLQDVFKRRLLINTLPPDSFTSLDGSIVAHSERMITSNVAVAKFQAHDTLEPAEVVLEYLAYNNALRQAIDAKQDAAITERMLPYRQLAWMLNQAPFPHEADSDAILAATSPALLTLRCLGYINQVAEKRIQFLFEAPKMSVMQEQLSIMSLHRLIQGTKPPPAPTSDTVFLRMWDDYWSSRIRPEASAGRMSTQPLRDRFFLAYALALTVLNIHSSGWVHKHLWSRGVIIVPSTKPSRQSRSTYLIPYVAGWDVARPTAAKETDYMADYDAEANLYRHPNRQQKPSARYTLIHDLYSLGVLLMEIGAWSTVDNMFRSQIRWAKKQGRAPDVDMVRVEWRRTVKAEVERQMGEGYANAVACCLLSDFGVAVDDHADTNLAVRFKTTVVDAIKLGIAL